MTYAQGLFIKRKHQPKQRKKDKTGSLHNKLRCECNNLVTDVVTSVHITLLCPDFLARQEPINIVLNIKLV